MNWSNNANIVARLRLASYPGLRVFSTLYAKKWVGLVDFVKESLRSCHRFSYGAMQLVQSMVTHGTIGKVAGT